MGAETVGVGNAGGEAVGVETVGVVTLGTVTLGTDTLGTVRAGLDCGWTPTSITARTVRIPPTTSLRTSRDKRMPRRVIRTRVPVQSHLHGELNIPIADALQSHSIRVDRVASARR